MREQTIVMHAPAGSKVFAEIRSKTEAVLFRGATFVLGLGCAYLAVCYGMPMPMAEKSKESNP